MHIAPFGFFLCYNRRMFCIKSIVTRKLIPKYASVAFHRIEKPYFWWKNAVSAKHIIPWQLPKKKKKKFKDKVSPYSWMPWTYKKMLEGEGSLSTITCWWALGQVSAIKPHVYLGNIQWITPGVVCLQSYRKEKKWLLIISEKWLWDHLLKSLKINPPRHTYFLLLFKIDNWIDR